MSGSQTAPGRKGARNSASVHIGFRQRYGVGAQNDVDFAAQWLAMIVVGAPPQRANNAKIERTSRQVGNRTRSPRQV